MLDHMILTVSDVERSLAFYKAAFTHSNVIVDIHWNMTAEGAVVRRDLESRNAEEARNVRRAWCFGEYRQDRRRDIAPAEEEGPVVLHDAAKGKAWGEAGADVAIADVDEEAALARAFSGAEGVYVLLPRTSVRATCAWTTIAAQTPSLRQSRPQASPQYPITPSGRFTSTDVLITRPARSNSEGHRVVDADGSDP